MKILYQTLLGRHGTIAVLYKPYSTYCDEAVHISECEWFVPGTINPND